MTKTILIAEDDSPIVHALTELLEDEGFRVASTVDGHTTSDAKAVMPDIILLDLWMGGKDGSEICRELKSSPATGSIPVIMMSANRDAETIAADAGADDFLAKPFDIEAMLAMIKRHLA